MNKKLILLTIGFLLSVFAYSVPTQPANETISIIRPAVIAEYKFATAYTIPELEKIINYFISLGFQPYGDAFICQGDYAYVSGGPKFSQAMVKYK